ncbi:unnamed protein product [Blepharisma stoltei]|uniref:GYF domain-containing protein n=1 Tax=Blepharisma stoltei TaxID=1481888 RepID=A0AAU9JC18_9CILI|nr:unnamed protein product [Blepharisma stoltei]
MSDIQALKTVPKTKPKKKKKAKKRSPIKYSRDTILNYFQISYPPKFEEVKSLDTVTTQECNLPILKPTAENLTETIPERHISKERKNSSAAPQNNPNTNKNARSQQRKETAKGKKSKKPTLVGQKINIDDMFNQFKEPNTKSNENDPESQNEELVFHDSRMDNFIRVNFQVPASSIIVYPKDLLEKKVKEGNPFAKIIHENSIESRNGQMEPTENSKAFESIWFYKDSSNEIQGPFNSYEMLNWTIAGYFDGNSSISCMCVDNFSNLLWYKAQQGPRQYLQ